MIRRQAALQVNQAAQARRHHQVRALIPALQIQALTVVHRTPAAVIQAVVRIVAVRIAVRIVAIQARNLTVQVIRARIQLIRARVQLTALIPAAHQAVAQPLWQLTNMRFMQRPLHVHLG